MFNSSCFKKKYILTALYCLSLSGLYGQAETEALLDHRDGKTYNTVKIGSQVWMTENLNYGEFAPVGEQNKTGVTKHCYDNEPENCSVYGGLYTWDQAEKETLCPKDWHVPSKEEWLTLSAFLGDKIAGEKSKASPQDKIPWDGSNKSGLNIIPSGTGNGEKFHRLNQWATFWTADASDEQRAWFVRFDGYWHESPPKYKSFLVDPYYLKSSTLSIRCIKNTE